jgi:transposase
LAIFRGDERMAQAYSDDLRCKILEAYAVGVGSLRELAAQFRVSWGYSKKIRVQQLRTGQKERPVQLRHGPQSRITEEVKASLRDWLRKQPDLTLAELRDRLEAVGVHVSRSLVGQVVQQMGLRRKKNPSMPKNKIRKQAASAVRRGGTR